MTENGPQSVAKEIITRTVTEGNLTEPETAYFLGSLVGAAFDTVRPSYCKTFLISHLAGCADAGGDLHHYDGSCALSRSAGGRPCTIG